MKGPWTLPNFITLLRLAMLPFFLMAISNGSFGLALGIFVAAGISDGIDGFLARRFDMRSALGAYLDPIADKLMLMSSYVFLSIPSYPGIHKIPFWLVVMVLSRDLLMLTVALLMILTAHGRSFRPTWVGKVTTVTLIVNVLFVLCGNLWDWPSPPLLIGCGASATVVLLSSFHYIYLVARGEEGAPQA